MEHKNNLPILLFTTYDEWITWLSEHFTSAGTWMKLSKKNSEKTSISYIEAREGALRYGWIDGQINTYDKDFYITRFTPRRPNSIWSKVNREIAEDLSRRDMLFPSGRTEVEAARADGRFDRAYDSSSTITTPADFQKALDAHPAAADFFRAISKANRYAFLWRLQTAKSPEKRASLIIRFVVMLEAGEVFHP